MCTDTKKSVKLKRVLQPRKENDIREAETAEWQEVTVKKFGKDVEVKVQRQHDKFACSVLHPTLITTNEQSGYLSRYPEQHKPLTSSSVLKSARPRFSILGKDSSVRKDLGNADTTSESPVRDGDFTVKKLVVMNLFEPETRGAERLRHLRSKHHPSIFHSTGLPVTRNRSAFPYQGVFSAINISSSVGATIHLYLGCHLFAQDEQLTSDSSGASAMAPKVDMEAVYLEVSDYTNRAILPLFYWNQAFKIISSMEKKLFWAERLLADGWIQGHTAMLGT
ncbi:hypothetical protein ARMGADRAFT_1033469 [Armillaria gallica]|uniref:Uncharacterized protein n=1 Tax=Armillaria gallica TaxID=47427 RepID=A0A2H3DF06_ARMGA|nr:hypothetical protein ARMGADRAFT_1033469 [Armillaria gallica]